MVVPTHGPAQTDAQTCADSDAIVPQPAAEDSARLTRAPHTFRLPPSPTHLSDSLAVQMDCTHSRGLTGSLYKTTRFFYELISNFGVFCSADLITSGTVIPLPLCSLFFVPSHYYDPQPLPPLVFRSLQPQLCSYQLRASLVQKIDTCALHIPLHPLSQSLNRPICCKVHDCCTHSSEPVSFEYITVVRHGKSGHDMRTTK